MDNKLILIPVPMDELLQQLREVIRAEIQAKQEQDSNAKLLASSEACKLFCPPVSTMTLAAWTKAGHLKDYRIAGRKYYRAQEIVEAAKHLKRYHHNS